MAEKGTRLGVAYYPEQWPRDRWHTDARMMAEAGLSLARIGEFAWSALEPEPGRFDFAWLDEAIEILHHEGLDIVLGTPTAAAPAWLIERHPDVLPIDINGRRQGFGNRRHYCPNQPAYQAATERIVRELARRFGSDRRVIGWQIDNEFGGRCFCDACRNAFREWLSGRYGSVEHLNSSWGTAFWSQTYTRWDQVPLPQPDPWDPNPGLALDYRRFMSDSYVRYQRLQANILRADSTGQFVTHNLMGFGFGEIDYGKLAGDLDLVSWDNYPGLSPDASYQSSALAADAMRGLKRKKFWVMEQQVGSVGWAHMRSPEPGQFRLWTYQAVAHGAEAVVFFRWRTARFGTEQHWHGILDADGGARGRYRDLRRLSIELRELAPWLTRRSPIGHVALLHDYDSRFALQAQPTNAALAYEETMQRHYEAMRSLGLGVDVLVEAAGLDRYRVVVAPNLYVVDPDLAGLLASYVAAGGTLVLAPRTGVKDRFNAIPERPLPALLDALCGARVTDYMSVAADEGATFGDDGSENFEGDFRGWYEQLEVSDASVVATYRDGAFAGSPAIVERDLGGGRVVYLAGAATRSTLDHLYRRLAHQRGLTTLDFPWGLEVVRLDGTSEGELLVVLNHLARTQRLALDGFRWNDHLSGSAGVGSFELGPYGVAVLEGIRLAPASPTG